MYSFRELCQDKSGLTFATYLWPAINLPSIYCSVLISCQEPPGQGSGLYFIVTFCVQLHKSKTANIENKGIEYIEERKSKQIVKKIVSYMCMYSLK